MEGFPASRAEKLIKDNLVDRLPLLSMGKIVVDVDDNMVAVHIPILVDGVDVMLRASVTFIGDSMHKVNLTKTRSDGDITYHNSYILGFRRSVELFLREKVVPDIEKADFYEAVLAAKETNKPLLDAIAHLRKYSPEHLVCQDDIKFLLLLADHFKYGTLGAGYEEAKGHFENLI